MLEAGGAIALTEVSMNNFLGFAFQKKKRTRLNEALAPAAAATAGPKTKGERSRLVLPDKRPREDAEEAEVKAQQAARDAAKVKAQQAAAAEVEARQAAREAAQVEAQQDALEAAQVENLWRVLQTLLTKAREPKKVRALRISAVFVRRVYITFWFHSYFCVNEPGNQRQERPWGGNVTQ